MQIVTNQTRRVFNKMVRTREIGKHLGFERKKNAVLDVMAKHHIASDIDKLPQNKKEAFFKDISRNRDLGAFEKNAIKAYYKNNAEHSHSMKPAIKAMNFGSNGGIRLAQQHGLIINDNRTPTFYDSKNAKDVDIRERLKSIQN